MRRERRLQRDDDRARGLFPSGEDAARVPPCAPELDPPFNILEPARLETPLIFSSPHSGSVYPASFIDAARLDAVTLRRSEDAYVDDLFMGALEVGAPLMRACFPRAYLDVNREPYELDPRMFDGRLPAFANTRSMRVAGGLGTLARVVGEAQEIYARRLPVAEAINRIESLYKPYHRALRQLLQRAAEIFGKAVLIDCHSMPSATGKGTRPEERVRADVVLGDRYGTSCDPTLVDVVEEALRKRGYDVQRNKPYAGGFITEHYGSPAGGWHALQIEVNRALYMDEKSLARRAAYARLRQDLTAVARALAAAAADNTPERRAAAE
jgi:N-formylglutamate amidohydrolase